jgi:broad specificity phosphatase PhoE
MPTLRLILVRHANAHAGFEGPIAGPTGCRGLTPLGRRQAEALREHFASSARVRPDTLLASVLPRAIETARIIAPGLGVELADQDCDLCEFHTGEADGVDWTEYNTRYGSFDMEAEPDRPFAPGGDSWNSFHGRVARTLDRLVHEHEGETVVAVSHAGFIIASMRLLLGITDPSTSAHLQPTNTGLTEWEWHEPSRRWILRYYNETVHLLGLAPPEEFSTDAARIAAARDELDEWVARFLSSPGSDNPELARLLSDPPRYWLGPVELPLDQLNRLAGPAGAPVLEVVEEDEWRPDVGELADKIDDGVEPPPVIVTYDDDQLKLEDGNHRVEALRRAGEDRTWAVVGFTSPDERDRFVTRGA